MRNRNETYANILKVGKRIAITILCCIPFIIVFAYLTRNIITNNALQIFIFMLIFAVAVTVEEVIVRSKEKKKKEQEVLDKNQDVFK